MATQPDKLPQRTTTTTQDDITLEQMRSIALNVDHALQQLPPATAAQLQASLETVCLRIFNNMTKITQALECRRKIDKLPTRATPSCARVQSMLFRFEGMEADTAMHTLCQNTLDTETKDATAQLERARRAGLITAYDTLITNLQQDCKDQLQKIMTLATATLDHLNINIMRQHPHAEDDFELLGVSLQELHLDLTNKEETFKETADLREPKEDQEASAQIEIPQINWAQELKKAACCLLDGSPAKNMLEQMSTWTTNDEDDIDTLVLGINGVSKQADADMIAPMLEKIISTLTAHSKTLADYTAPKTSPASHMLTLLQTLRSSEKSSKLTENVARKWCIEALQNAKDQLAQAETLNALNALELQEQQRVAEKRALVSDQVADLIKRPLQTGTLLQHINKTTHDAMVTHLPGTGKRQRRASGKDKNNDKSHGKRPASDMSGMPANANNDLRAGLTAKKHKYLQTPAGTPHDCEGTCDFANTKICSCPKPQRIRKSKQVARQHTQQTNIPCSLCASRGKTAHNHTLEMCGIKKREEAAARNAPPGN